MILSDTESKTDEELTDAILTGDREAFGELMSRNRRRYTVCAKRIVGCWEDAEDVVQEAIMSAFRRLDKFRGECPFGAYVHFVVIGKAYDRLTGRKHTMPMNEAWQEPSTTASSPLDDAIRNERVAGVRLAIESLREPYRTTYTLRGERGLKLREIAAELGVPMGTVAGHIYRGEKMLCEQLESLSAEAVA